MDSSPQKTERTRCRLLREMERLTETPLMILGFTWLGLLIVELLNKGKNQPLNSKQADDLKNEIKLLRKEIENLIKRIN